MTDHVGARGGRTRLLQRDEELDLARRSLNGDLEARKKIIDAHDPLVLGEINKWLNGNNELMGQNRYGDMVQEGRLALLESLDRFDPERGLRFSTFAMWRVKNAISTYAHRLSGPVATARNPGEKRVFHNFNSLKREIEDCTGRPLDDDGRAQIAQTLDVSVDVVVRIEQRLKNDDVPLEGPVSNDIGDDRDQTVHADIISDDAPAPEETVGRAEYDETLRRIIHDTIQAMPQRIAYIISRRWFYESEQSPSLHLVAGEIGLGREQTRILERRGQAMIRKALEQAGLDGPDWDSAVGEVTESAPQNARQSAPRATPAPRPAVGEPQQTRVLTGVDETGPITETRPYEDGFRAWLLRGIHDEGAADRQIERIHFAERCLGERVSDALSRLGSAKEVIAQVKATDLYARAPRGYQRSTAKAVHRFAEYRSSGRRAQRLRRDDMSAKALTAV